MKILPFPLQDQIPPNIKDLLLDFWWDLDKLHTLADSLPTRTLNTADLLWHLDMPYWKHNDKPFQLTPRQVWEAPEKYQEQYERTLAADLSFPIIIREKDGKVLFMDGVHRLLKAVMQDVPSLQSRVFSGEHTPAIAHREERQ